MNPVTELHRVQKRVATKSLGRHQVEAYVVETPAHRFVNLLRLRRDPWVLLRCRSGWNPALAEAILDRVDQLDLGSLDGRSVSVVNGMNAHGYRHLAIVPPALAQCFAHRSPTLAENIYWVLPVHPGEFTGGEGLRDFDTALDGQVPVLDWKRDPAPQLQMALWTHSGGFVVGRSDERPSRVPRARLGAWLRRLSTDGPNHAVLYNAWGGTTRLHRTEDGYHLAGGGALPLNDALGEIDGFLAGR